MNDVAGILGLPRVGTAALPEGVRELRVSDEYSMIGGTPEPVLRLLQGAGRTTGQVVFVWREYVAWPKRYRETKCTPWTDSARACVFISPVALDWASVATRFEELGAWTIADSCDTESHTLPNGKVEMTLRHFTDSGVLYLGRIVGSTGSTYSCNAPHVRTRTSEGRASKALYEYFLDVAKKSGEPPTV